MSSITENLGLTLPAGSEWADVAVLNENWAKIDQQVLRAMAAAAAYDAGATYQKGAYCTQGGLLYRANRAIAQPEAWTAGHWTAISVTDVIRGLTAADVGAAPAGYGLGGGATILTSADDLNNIWECGFYRYTSEDMPQNAVAASWLNIMRVESTSSGAFAQTVYGITANENYKWAPIARRFIYGSASIPWEYFNPTLLLGVEYRTTERYQGNPVYVKLIDCGVFPTAGVVKTVSLNISNLGSIVKYDATCEIASLPLMASSTSMQLQRCINVLGTTTSDPCVRMHCGLAEPDNHYQAKVAVYYTKTTD